MSKKVTKEEFVRRANEKHAEKYTYESVFYEAMLKKVSITCPIHGEFLQKPADHLGGHGCPKCKSEKSACKWDDIKDKFYKVHGDHYLYDETTYFRNSVKMKMFCPTHGEFWQKPELHKNGSGCKLCTASGGPGVYNEKFFDKNPHWKNKEAFIYLIQLKSTEEQYYKIGITINFKERIQSYLRTKFDVTPIWYRRDKLYNCFLLEQEVLSKCEHYKYVPKNTMSSGGKTECLTEGVLNELFKVA